MELKAGCGELKMLILDFREKISGSKSTTSRITAKSINMTGFDLPSRREFLISSATVTAAGIAGCFERIEDPVPFLDRAKGSEIDFPGDGDYRTAHADRQRTGHLAEVTGPSGNVKTGWHFLVEGAQFPRIADGNVYVATDWGVLALDASNGQRQWRYKDASPYRITVRDGRVFFYDGRHVALDAETGEVVWTSSYDAIERRTTGSPLYANGLLFDVTFDGEVVAVNATTGRPIWMIETDAKPTSEVPLSYAAGRLVLAGDDHTLVVLDAESGDVQQSLLIPSGVRGAPALGDERIYVPTFEWADDVTFSLASVDPTTSETGWNWTPPKEGGPAAFGPVIESPALADGQVVATTDPGGVVSLNAENGEIQWQASPDTFSGGASTPPVVADGTVYVGGNERTVALNAETGEHLWSVDTWAQWGEIAIADGVIVVCNHEGIYTVVEA